jgi:hypothetical protein
LAIASNVALRIYIIYSLLDWNLEKWTNKTLRALAIFVVNFRAVIEEVIFRFLAYYDSNVRGQGAIIYQFAL